MAEKRIHHADDAERTLSNVSAPGAREKRGSIYQIVPPGERRMSAQGRRISVVDDIFGEIKEGGPNYRNVTSPNQYLCHGTKISRLVGSVHQF